MASAKEKIAYRLQDSGNTWLAVSKIPFSVSPNESGIIFRSWSGKEYVTLKRVHEMEVFIANWIFKASKTTYSYDTDLADRFIREFEEAESQRIGKTFALAEEQKEGVHTLLRNKIAIITGGPGTGKTAVLKCAAYVLEKIFKIKVEFCAPTGKAARRITESTGYEACTINSKIGDGVEVKELSPLCVDILINDEFSMNDMEIFFKTLLVYPAKGRLFLVGDVDQLPSVGIGAVLRDLIDSRCVDVCALEKTFRQDNNSVLFENIQITKKGGFIPYAEGDDFVRIKEFDEPLETLLAQYEIALKKYGMENVVVLTPYRRKGSLCANAVNNILQQKYNPKGEKPFVEVTVVRDGIRRDIRFQVGDPVIQLDNRKCGIANGDIGTIIAIENEMIYVQFSDKILAYTERQLYQLELAYALSVHKSQGSEYACVISPFLEEHKNLDRNLIYTAITRAKKCFVCIGKDETIMAACKKQSSWERTTFLKEEIQALMLKEQITNKLEEM